MDFGECIERGAEAFGWGDAMTVADGPIRRGRGMANIHLPGRTRWPLHRADAAGSGRDAASRFRRDGRWRGQHHGANADSGESLGVTYDQVSGTFGDTAHTPDSPITAGSTVTFSAGLAVKQAAADLRGRMIAAASDALDLPPSELTVDETGIVATSGARLSFAELAARTGEIEGEASVSPGSTDYVVNSFGAHFAEVEVDTDTGKFVCCATSPRTIRDAS